MQNEKLEKRRLIKKKYYDTHKEEINEKVQCECGKMINKSNLNKHRKTNIHEKLLKPKVEITFKRINLYKVIDLLKRFVDNDFKDEKEKKFYEDSLIYTINYDYIKYYQAMIVELNKIYEYLKNNIDKMFISNNTKEKLKIITEQKYIYFTYEVY